LTRCAAGKLNDVNVSFVVAGPIGGTRSEAVVGNQRDIRDELVAYPGIGGRSPYRAKKLK